MPKKVEHVAEIKITEVVEISDHLKAQYTERFGPQLGFIVWGDIFNDNSTHGNHPFRDGTEVRTSPVKDIVRNGEDTYLVTLNTTYKVRNPRVLG